MDTRLRTAQFKTPGSKEHLTLTVRYMDGEPRMWITDSKGRVFSEIYEANERAFVEEHFKGIEA